MALYRIAGPAKEDLRQIRVYTTQQWGRKQWTAYRGVLVNTFRKLAENPKLGAERNDIRHGSRSFLEANQRLHRIYYREIKGGIVIARILHHAQEPEAEA